MTYQDKQKRRTFILWIIGAAVVVWFAVIVFILPNLKNKPLDVTVDVPQMSAVQTPSSDNMPTLNFQSTSFRRHRVVGITPVSSSMPTYSFKSASTGSYSTAYKVHTTSSATVHSVGGGSGARDIGGAINSSVTNSSPLVTSTSSILLASAVRLQSRNLNAASTMAAEGEVIQENGPARRMGHRGFQPDPDIPFPDEEEDMPIGDIPWLVLLGLVSLYIVARRARSRVSE